MGLEIIGFGCNCGFGIYPAQVEKKYTAQALQCLVTSARLRAEMWQREAEALLAGDPGESGHCHTEVLVRAAKRGLEHEAVAPRKRRLMGKTPAPYVPGSSDDGVNLKGRVSCPRCLSIVRRDVIARHMRSAKCQARAAAASATGTRAAEPPTVTCGHCGAEVVHLARHLRSRQCSTLRLQRDGGQNSDAAEA